jgi:hypothetical protein
VDGAADERYAGCGGGHRERAAEAAAAGHRGFFLCQRGEWTIRIIGVADLA